jgi:hypothetical protein
MHFVVTSSKVERYCVLGGFVVVSVSLLLYHAVGLESNREIILLRYK